jgi:hypothetical protein
VPPSNERTGLEFLEEYRLMKHQYPSSALIVPVAVAVLAMAGCNRSPEPASDAQAGKTAAEVDSAQAQAAQAEAARAEEARAAELAAREKELAEREYALQQKELEQELARREQEAAAEAAAAAAAAKAAKASSAKQATVKTPPPAAPTPQPAAPPPPIVVPAGTQLAVELTSAVGTKTAAVGDRVQGRLASDLVVDGRRAAGAGSTVLGSVSQVVSGSKKIGGTPTLGIVFDSLVVATGETASIRAPLLMQGQSETGKDTAKIVGGAAAGAIIGHQIDHKKGSVIGGIIGGAAGTAAAHSTGSEVNLAAGSIVAVATESAFQVDAR